VRLRRDVALVLPVWREVLSVQLPPAKGSSRLFGDDQPRDLAGIALQYGPRQYS
jgi:hypothetical protein